MTIKIVLNDKGNPPGKLADAVNGERRSFALLCPSADAFSQERVRDLVLAAYAAHETEHEVQP